MKKIASMIIIPITILTLGYLTSCINPVVEKEYVQVEYIQGIRAFDINDIQTLIDNMDHVFIAYIEKESHTENSIYGATPETFYDLTIVESFKGDLEGEILLRNFGGIDQEGVMVLFEGDELPAVGNYYLFLTKGDSNMVSVDSIHQKIFIGESIEDYNKVLKDLDKYIEKID